MKLYKRIVFLPSYNEKSLLQNSIEEWKNEIRANANKSIPMMLEHLEDNQQNLMRNPLNKFLWLQGKTL